MCRRAAKYIKDFPSISTAACMIVPAIGWVTYTNVGWHHDFGEINHGSIAEMYLGLAAVAAICGGFAGVIIVFGLTSSSDLFRRFRIRSGERMAANWVSIVVNAFLAAAMAILATVLEVLIYRTAGAFVFISGCLLLLHSSIRSVWVLRMLLQLVNTDDLKAQQDKLGKVNSPPAA